MNWFEFPFALFAILGVAAVVPPWIYFLNEFTGGMSGPSQFLAWLALPAILLLFLSSWLEPGGIR